MPAAHQPKAEVAGAWPQRSSKGQLLHGWPAHGSPDALERSQIIEHSSLPVVPHKAVAEVSK